MGVWCLCCQELMQNYKVMVVAKINEGGQIWATRAWEKLLKILLKFVESQNVRMWEFGVRSRMVK